MRLFAATLVAQLVGAAALLLFATRAWQTVTTVRTRPFADDVLPISGRTVDGAVTALALVALAGVVAVIATNGSARRVIGALVALAGLIALWRIVAALPAVGAARAMSLVRDAHPQVAGTPHVTTHPVWAALSIVAAALVVAAGVLTVVHGARWRGLSARYERRAPDPEQARARADASLWTALERGEDPTARNPRDGG
ncbi:MAG TPA: Trp biosynthesis-associated membrane protein [Jatrophihabitans sp.]|jgi:uncharacterized membrane protein (TIGR02234 family)